VPVRLRCVYCDLDGTLLGRRASLVHDGNGDFSLLGVRALEACARADVEFVPYSGRRRLTLGSDARLLGARAWIFEAGCGLVIDGEEEWLTDGLVPRDGVTIHEQIERTGAPALLLERFAGRLEYHTPWNVERDVSHLFRGLVDAFEADTLLMEHGHGHLRLVDNGAIAPRTDSLPGVDAPRAYHLIPRAASKGRAVARHMQARGYAREECIAIGDSREDITAAEVVSAFWLVANAVARDPSMSQAIAGVPNVRVAEEAHGAGVYEAVLTTLAERRG
jgi:hydroxymethylpyrimidine pyrophosphatase-like HAD family hydrolase